MANWILKLPHEDENTLTWHAFVKREALSFSNLDGGERPIRTGSSSDRPDSQLSDSGTVATRTDTQRLDPGTVPSGTDTQPSEAGVVEDANIDLPLWPVATAPGSIVGGRRPSAHQTAQPQTRKIVGGYDRLNVSKN
jgi:hypothetical protein